MNGYDKVASYNERFQRSQIRRGKYCLLSELHAIAVNCRIECFVAHKQSPHTIKWWIVHCMAKYLKFSDVGLETWSRSRDLAIEAVFWRRSWSWSRPCRSWSRPQPWYSRLDLRLGLSRPDLEIQARRTVSTKHGIAMQHNDQRLLQSHEMTRSGQISAADHSLRTLSYAVAKP
jgi:hypothetical protein